MRAKKPFVGVDLGGTNMQIGVVSPEEKIIGSSKRKTKADEGLDAVVERIAEGIIEACVTAQVDVASLGGIGIGAPGVVDPGKGIVVEAVNLRWRDTPLAAILGKRLKVPVSLDNDVNVALYGEYMLGAAKGRDYVLGVWVGTGVGGALILDGKLYYGKLLSAGEIGHTILMPNNPLGHRSLEHNCSRSAVVDRIVRLIKSGRRSKLTNEVGDDFEKIKSGALGRAYASDDYLTREVVDEAAELLGISIANVVTLLSIDHVVLGGGLTEAIGKPFVEAVEKSARKFAFPDICKKVDVVASKLEDQAGVFGAAMIAVERAG
jgi:glucokinase